MGKIFELTNIPFKDNQVTLISGYFDILHPGHVEALNKCKAIGNRLVVGVHSDELARNKSVERPIMGEKDRVYMVSQLGCVDFAFVQRKFLYEDSGELLQKIKPRCVIFSTDDKTNSAKTEQIDFIKNNFKEIEVKFIPRQRQDISSTLIIETILKKFKTN